MARHVPHADADTLGQVLCWFVVGQLTLMVGGGVSLCCVLVARLWNWAEGDARKRRSRHAKLFHQVERFLASIPSRVAIACGIACVVAVVFKAAIAEAPTPPVTTSPNRFALSDLRSVLDAMRADLQVFESTEVEPLIWVPFRLFQDEASAFWTAQETFCGELEDIRGALVPRWLEMGRRGDVIGALWREEKVRGSLRNMAKSVDKCAAARAKASESAQEALEGMSAVDGEARRRQSSGGSSPAAWGEPAEATFVRGVAFADLENVQTRLANATLGLTELRKTFQHLEDVCFNVTLARVARDWEMAQPRRGATAPSHAQTQSLERSIREWEP